MKDHVIEREWSSCGLDCLVIRHRTHLTPCGYVRVPEDHPWFGKSFRDEVQGPPADLDSLTVDDVGPIPALLATTNPQRFAATMAAHVAVHGGLNFSGKMIDRDGWWIGFDCSHFGDYSKFCPGGRRWTTDDVCVEVQRMVVAVLGCTTKKDQS